MVRTKIGHRRGARTRERAARDPEAAPRALSGPDPEGVGTRGGPGRQGRSWGS